MDDEWERIREALVDRMLLGQDAVFVNCHLGFGTILHRVEETGYMCKASFRVTDNMYKSDFYPVSHVLDLMERYENACGASAEI